ncbi:MAG TPA: protein kinase [Planctomycetota bacterium]|nr:protein kinase [Planctomycetota bacterium]
MPLLYVEKGIDKGISFPCTFTSEKPITIGRSVKCDITLNDCSTSRNHLEIYTKEGQYFLEDKGSLNGTIVNGQSIQNPYLLKDGDRIEIGETIFTWQLEQDITKDPFIGKDINGHQIVKKLGRGGMGVVYLARQVFLERDVALKIIMPKHETSQSVADLFLQETRACATLNHPNIIQIYDAGKWDIYYYFTMEYAANGAIQDKIVGGNKIPWEEAIPYMLDTAAGLEYAEKKKIVHRDIKPDNLMLSNDNRVKIVDLGIACRFDQINKDEQIYGTPHYVSPEQIQGHPVDFRSDMYSFGATFYRILSGNTPFHGRTPQELLMKHLQEKPEPLKNLDLDIPERLSDIIDKMMQKDPNQRYASNSEIIKALQNVSKFKKNRSVATRSKMRTGKISSMAGKNNYRSNIISNKVTSSISRRELLMSRRRKNYTTYYVYGVIFFLLILFGVGLYLHEQYELRQQKQEELRQEEKALEKYQKLIKLQEKFPHDYANLKKYYQIFLEAHPNSSVSKDISERLQNIITLEKSSTSKTKLSTDNHENKDIDQRHHTIQDNDQKDTKNESEIIEKLETNKEQNAEANKEQNAEANKEQEIKITREVAYNLHDTFEKIQTQLSEKQYYHSWNEIQKLKIACKKFSYYELDNAINRLQQNVLRKMQEYITNYQFKIEQGFTNKSDLQSFLQELEHYKNIPELQAQIEQITSNIKTSIPTLLKELEPWRAQYQFSKGREYLQKLYNQSPINAHEIQMLSQEWQGLERLWYNTKKNIRQYRVSQEALQGLPKSIPNNGYLVTVLFIENTKLVLHFQKHSTKNTAKRKVDIHDIDPEWFYKYFVKPLNKGKDLELAIYCYWFKLYSHGYECKTALCNKYWKNKFQQKEEESQIWYRNNIAVKYNNIEQFSDMSEEWKRSIRELEKNIKIFDQEYKYTQFYKTLR